MLPVYESAKKRRIVVPLRSVVRSVCHGDYLLDFAARRVNMSLRRHRQH